MSSSSARQRAGKEPPRSPEKETPSVPSASSKSGHSPIYYAVVVLLAIGLGFVLGMGFFPTIVDSPKFSLDAGTSPEKQAPVDSDLPETPRQERSAQEPPASSGSESSTSTDAETEAQAKSSSDKTVRLFTKEELQQYDGSDESKPVYLAILGKVFDVSKGKKYYGKGGGYSFFAGRDSTRAFVSGNFTEEGLVEDVTGIEDVLGIEEWLSFYRKDYKYVGKLIGHFYDENGKATEHMKEYKKEVKLANKRKLDEDEERKVFPPCNSHWAQGKGGTVWCSNERLVWCQRP